MSTETTQTSPRPEPQPAATPVALGYCRVSTDRQETERQEHMIRSWCSANGYELDTLHREDSGVSGRAAVVKRGRAAGRNRAGDLSQRDRSLVRAALNYYSDLAGERFGSLERLGLSRLLGDIVSREITCRRVRVVVFYALDRMSRDCIELLLLEVILREHGVAIVSVSEGGVIDTSTASGRFLYRIMAAKAELECDQTGERTSATLRRMVDRGQQVGRLPVGWTVVKGDNNATVGYRHTEDWVVVEEVHRRRAAGETYSAIATACGLCISMVKSYLDSYKWQPPLPLMEV